jgi:modulator of FtsH protease
MQSRIIVDSREESLLSTHKVLRNTYFLLALTLAFSAVVAYVSMAMNLPRPGLIMLVGFYGLLFLTNALANSALGILSAFAFTGFLGYTVGPILNAYVSAGLGDAIVLALAGTAATFFACSAYVLTTKKDMSFLSGTILALFVVLLLGMVASFFFQFPALYVGISALFVIFSTMGILYETSNIIHGGETNYIRATVSLFVSIYNLFISLLNLLSFFSSRD